MRASGSRKPVTRQPNFHVGTVGKSAFDLPRYNPPAWNQMKRITSGRYLLGGSASCQLMRGTSDKAPTPSRAIGNYLQIATPRIGVRAVCVLRQERAFLRRLDTPSGPVGYFCEIARGSYLVDALLWYFHGKSVPDLADVRESCEPTLRCWRAGKHRSKAIYCAGLVQSKNDCRRFGNCAHRPACHNHAASAIATCIYQSNISCEYGSQTNQPHKQCNLDYEPPHDIATYWRLPQ